jgi:uncharacterized protein (TIGR03086 family)
MGLNHLVTRAAAEAANTVRGVKPNQLDGATPCQEWTVRALINHLRQVIGALSLAGRGETVPNELWEREYDDAAPRFGDEADRAVAAWADRAPGEGTVRMGTADMPATVVATMLASDLVIHGWDLARATGQDYRCDGEVAEMTRRFIAETGEQGRSMGIFAGPVPVVSDASVLDQALGLSGRDPHWSPPDP